MGSQINWSDDPVLLSGSKSSNEVDLRVRKIPQQSCLPSEGNLIIEIWITAPEQSGILTSEYGWKYFSRGELPHVHFPVGSDEGSL